MTEEGITSLAMLLGRLRHLGLTLSRAGGSLVVHGPKGALTTELRHALAAFKHELLDRLVRLDEGKPSDGPLPSCVPDPDRLYEPFPMSDLQLGFYLADDPHMEFHVRPHFYSERDTAGLDVARYEAAWNRMLQRHARELVVACGDGMLQTLRNPAPLRIQVADLRGTPAPQVQQALMRIRRQMMRSELPLDRWPWHDIRVSLWRDQGGDRARIHCNHNSFYSDGLGSNRAAQEVDRYYENPALVLPPLTLSYRDAVLALDALARSDRGQAARRYWEHRLADLPPPPALPTRAGIDRRCRSRLQRREQVLPAAAWKAFKVQAAHHGVTPSNAIFAAYAEVLAAWSNCRHFVLSNMMTRRLPVHPEITDLIGNFVSLYPLEIDLRQGASFAERARAVQEQVVRDSQQLHWGGMQVLQSINRQSGGFGRAPIPFVVGSGLTLEGWRRFDFACLETPQVMLDHQFFELADGCLLVQWDLLEEFFPAGMVDDMWAAHLGLLKHLAADPQAWGAASFDLIPVHQLAPRQDGEPRPPVAPAQLLHAAWAATPADAPQAGLVTPAGTWSRGALAQGARVVAAQLQAAGIGRGHTVAVVADRGAALLVAVYGVLMAGAAYVPIDPTLPDDRRTRLLRDSEARCVVTESHHLERLPWPRGLPLLAADRIDASAPATVVPAGEPSDLAYLIYTSGSTGQPKGVMIDHRGAHNTLADINERFGVGPQDRLFGVSSFGFDLSVYDIFGAGLAGATLVYPTPDQALDPAHWLERVLHDKVSVWNSVPALAALLAEAAERRGVQLPALRLVLLSGDWIPLDLPDRLRRIAPAAQVVSLGGATEASIWSIIHPVERIDPDWTSIPYGRPLRNQSWFVLDEQGRPAPDWVPGELYIGGMGLALGYWRDAEKTAASFIPHPRTGERIYRTGDFGRYLPGGVIEFLGRRDGQVKLHGHRIELGEIEAALLATAGVAAVVVQLDRPADGRPALLAHVVPAAGAALSADTLRQQLARTLPDHMVPRHIDVIDRLPLTANGKVDRQALPRPAADAAARGARARHQAPRDPCEAGLLRIWQQVLARQDIGTGDDIFELGAQSLEAVRAIGMVREAFGMPLSLGSLWQDRSIERMAARLRSGQQAPARCLVPLISAPHATSTPSVPLFVVHPAGGQVWCYRELAARLARPVQAFQAPGEGEADGWGIPPASIEAFADAYLRAMPPAPPHAPIVLGGWSSGALVAYEMAARLRKQGRTVTGVLVIDSPAPLVHAPVADAVLFEWFIGDLDLPPALRTALAAAVLSGLTEAQRLLRAAALMRSHGAVLGSDDEQLAATHRVFKAMVQASRRYHAPATDLDLLVVRAAHGEVGEFASHPEASQADWGWRQVTGGHVRTCTLEATHHTVLAAPAVHGLATAVDQWLAHLEKHRE